MKRTFIMDILWVSSLTLLQRNPDVEQPIFFFHEVEYSRPTGGNVGVHQSKVHQGRIAPHVFHRDPQHQVACLAC